MTTHILDTANGQPAAGVAIRLYARSAVGSQRTLLAERRSNRDGRTDEALLEGSAWQTGSVELEFDIGDYFAEARANAAEPPFLDTVVIRCTLGEDAHYHVPLLVSPWSYSTYRGS